MHAPALSAPRMVEVVTENDGPYSMTQRAPSQVQFAPSAQFITQDELPTLVEQRQFDPGAHSIVARALPVDDPAVH